MKRTLLTFATGLALALSSLAADRTFKTLDGTKYEKATVTRVETDGISIEYDAGLAKIAFVNLPADVQKEFGYVPPAPLTKEQQQAQAEADRQRLLAVLSSGAANTKQATKEPQPQSQPAAVDKEREAQIDKRANELAKAAFKTWQKNAGRGDQGTKIGNRVFLDSPAPKMPELVEQFKAKLRAGEIQ